MTKFSKITAKFLIFIETYPNLLTLKRDTANCARAYELNSQWQRLEYPNSRLHSQSLFSFLK